MNSASSPLSPRPVQHTTPSDAHHRVADSTTVATTTTATPLYALRHSTAGVRLSPAAVEEVVVFTARPSLRRVRLWMTIYLALLLLLLTGGGLGVAYYLVPIFLTSGSGSSGSGDSLPLYLFVALFSLAFALKFGGGVINALREKLVLASLRHTVTTRHIEAAGGVFSRGKHLIPMAAIRDVSSFATYDQRLLGLGDVMVVATYGSGITLHDVTDHEAKCEAIWSLVRK